MKTQLTALALTTLLAATPVFAQTTANVGLRAGLNASTTGVRAGASASVETRITTAKNRAGEEIDRRTSALNALNAKVQAMAKISSEIKTSISTSVTSEIAQLATLKTKIEADTDLDTLKTDIKSIANSYRIFMLVIPQGRIEVAADRIQTAAASLTTLAGKLQTRITDAQTSGYDTAALSVSLSDMNAKISDVNAQASAAVSAVASLKPDNGDTATQQANTAAIKDARTKLQAAMKEIQTARQDAHDIVKGLMAFGASANASASSTVTN